MSSDKDRIAELEAQLARAQSALAEKTTTLKNTKKRLVASVKQVREKDVEVRELKANLVETETDAKANLKGIDTLITQLITHLRIQSHVTLGCLFQLAELVSEWRKNHSPFTSQQIRDGLDKAATAITDMAAGNQLDEIDQKLFWWSKSVFGLHGYAVAHHVLNQAEEDHRCLCEDHANRNAIKAKIEDRLKMI